VLNRSSHSPLPTVDDFNGIDHSGRGNNNNDRTPRLIPRALSHSNTTYTTNNTNNTTTTTNDDHFTQTMMKMYPRSAAAFLRAMTICGFGGLIFHLHTAFWWANESMGLSKTGFVHCITTNENFPQCFSGYRNLVTNLPSYFVTVYSFALRGPQPLSPEAHVRWMWLTLQIFVGILKVRAKRASEP